MFVTRFGSALSHQVTATQVFRFMQVPQKGSLQHATGHKFIFATTRTLYSSSSAVARHKKYGWRISAIRDPLVAKRQFILVNDK